VAVPGLLAILINLVPRAALFNVLNSAFKAAAFILLLETFTVFSTFNPVKSALVIPFIGMLI